MKNKLIYLPPQQLDPRILHWIEDENNKKEWQIRDPQNLKFDKKPKQLGEPTEAWDDNKQHTEDMS